MNLHQRKLDPERKRRIEALLQDEPELREQLFPTQTTPLDRALRILSLVRAFDRSMYEEVCRSQDGDLPAFNEIIESPDVQLVPRTEGRFWLREMVQNSWAEYWDQNPDQTELWASRFFDWLDRHQGLRTERLALLLRFDQERALQFLKTAFEEADAKDDLIVCHALTQQVEGDLLKIDSGLRQAFSEFVARYRGRAWFLREFHRTIKYFPRRSAEEAFEALINGDDSRWILYLSSPGGMGKTMFVQRMIAHELLKKRPSPLVARLDLDDIQVAEIAKAPWLVAVELAEELDEQLTRRLFSEGSNYLANVRSFSGLLYRRESERGRTLSDDQRNDLRKLASEHFAHWDGFKSRCMELPRDRPLVIFIDTIEEATLHWPDEFREVLRRFEELRSDLPQLRLILSGRYAPTTKDEEPDLPPGEPRHFPQYDKKLRTQTSFVRLNLLATDEAERFIRCQVPEVDEQLMEVMISAGGGNPFKLSMLCEIVSQDPQMDAATLKEYGDNVDVAYLIKRVVERIPVADELGLRWVLRYGAVPRRLTRSFLEKVLHPLLIRALRGEIEEAREDVPTDIEREAWLKKADAALDPGHLWEKLSKYASDHSWISQQTRDSDTATLHPDVVKPMRRLLRQQRIFNRLHHDAVDHFVKVKAEHPDRWVEPTLAELYHRVQLGEDRVHETLLKALDERPSPNDAGLRLEVLGEIVKPDGDFAGAPAAFLAHAYYEVADATAIEANFDYLPQGSRRDHIRGHLREAIELNRAAEGDLHPFVFKWRDFLDRNFPTKWSAISDLLLVTKSDESRTRYWLLIIEMLAQAKLSAGVFESFALFAGMSAGRIASRRIPSWVVQERTANAYMRRGEHASAIKYLRGILNDWKEPREGKHFERIQTSLIELLARSGRLRDAEQEMEKGASAADERNQDRLLLRVEMCLLRRDAWTGLALLEKAQDKQSYRYHLLRGKALGQLLRIGDASSAFAEAKAAGIKLGTAAQLDEIGRDELFFRSFEAGLPTEPDRPRLSPAGAALELELIRAHQMRENRAVCEPIIRTLMSDRYPEADRARATLAGVSWGLLPSKVIDDAFLSILRRVGDAGSRLLLMEPPVLLGQAEPWRLGWFKRWELRDSLGPSSTLGANRMDWVRYGRALLAMGDRKRADAAFANAHPGESATAAELAVFRQRCLGDPEAPFQPVAFWEALRSEPALHAAALVENAERALGRGERFIAAESLARAGSVLHSGLVDRILVERHRAVQDAFDGTAPSGEKVTRTAPAERPEGGASLADYRCGMLAIDAERIAIEPVGGKRRLLSTSENESMRILCAYSRERSPRRLAPYFLKRWPAPVEELHEPLEVLLNASAQNEETVLLALAHHALVAVPWELAIPRSHAPVRIGNGRGEGPIADEIRQPAQIRRAARFIAGLASPHPRPMPQIGIYRVKYSPRPDMIEQMSILDERIMASNLWNYGEPTSADVVYIMSDIEDSPSLSEPCLPGGMTAEMLGREFRREVEAVLPKPFVVLHSPASQSLSSALEQLFARNRFAQALVNSGVVSGVLATGVTSSAKDPYRQDLLLESLRRAGSWLDVMRFLRASSAYPASVGSLEEMLGLPATALFLSTDSGAA